MSQPTESCSQGMAEGMDIDIQEAAEPVTYVHKALLAKVMAYLENSGTNTQKHLLSFKRFSTHSTPR